MSTAFDEIRAALMNQLEVYRAANSAIVAWPNVKYEPVKGTSYLEPSFFPGEAEQGVLGTNGVNKQIGIFQILIWEPIGIGIGAMTIKADAIVTQFKRGTDLTKNSTIVTLASAWAGGAIQNGDWIYIPVTVNWYSYTAN